MYQPGNPQIVHTGLGGDDDACEETTYVRATRSDVSYIRLMSRGAYVTAGSPVRPFGAFRRMSTKRCQSDVRLIG